LRYLCIFSIQTECENFNEKNVSKKCEIFAKRFPISLKKKPSYHLYMQHGLRSLLKNLRWLEPFFPQHLPESRIQLFFTKSSLFSFLFYLINDLFRNEINFLKYWFSTLYKVVCKINTQWNFKILWELISN